MTLTLLAPAQEAIEASDDAPLSQEQKRLIRDSFTRIEPASAIHDYIELWHNTRRRHSALGMRTPIEIEHAWTLNNGVISQSRWR